MIAVASAPGVLHCLLVTLNRHQQAIAGVNLLPGLHRVHSGIAPTMTRRTPRRVVVGGIPKWGRGGAEWAGTAIAIFLADRLGRSCAVVQILRRVPRWPALLGVPGCRHDQKP